MCYMDLSTQSRDTVQILSRVLKSANNVGNINKHSRVVTKEQNQFASRRKGSPPLWAGSCLDNTIILRHLFFCRYKLLEKKFGH